MKNEREIRKTSSSAPVGKPRAWPCAVPGNRLQPDHGRFFYRVLLRQPLIVLAISIAMVMGPTPPGTGVIALHLGATPG